MNIFDEIMKYCPFLKETIENKITEEVEKAKAEKEGKIKELQATLEDLTSSILMGGK